MPPPYIVIFQKDKGDSHLAFEDQTVAESFAEKCKLSNIFHGLCHIQNGNVNKIDVNEILGGWSVDRYISEHLPDNYKIDERNKERQLSVKTVAQSYGFYSLIIASTILLTALANTFSPYKINAVISVCLATFFYSASTLGYLVTWKIQSLSGETPPERLNANLLVAGYILGTLFTILSLDLQ